MKLAGYAKSILKYSTLCFFIKWGLAQLQRQCEGGIVHILGWVFDTPISLDFSIFIIFISGTLDLFSIMGSMIYFGHVV